MRPVPLFRQFHEVSKYIKVVKFGSVEFKLFKFEVGTSIEFELNGLIRV
jgi:hypothetical protein